MLDGEQFVPLAQDDKASPIVLCDCHWFKLELTGMRCFRPSSTDWLQRC